MDTDPLSLQLASLQQFYKEGHTLSCEFRTRQLKQLKNTILRYEGAINDALKSDLGKGEEETYVSETGLILAAISHTLRKLKKWMTPVRAGTDLANLPSSSRLYRDPLGVVLIIAPWNYPLQLLLIPLVGAIAGGNCAVLKPSELAPATALLAEKIIKETFDPAYISLVNGDGASVVPALMNAFRFDHVFYTGSIAVGKSIYRLAAEKLVPVTLELGGKSPAIVEKDADLGVAARRIALGKFSNAGQTCIAPDYLLVQQEVKERFLEKLKACIHDFYGNAPMENPEYCKIINERRFDVLTRFLAGGQIIYGGNHNREKLSIEPTLLEGVSLEDPVMKEEIFGPILPVIAFTTRQEAIDIISFNPNPLALYLFTTNREAEREWISGVRFGGGCINNAVWQFTNHHLPFGGVGNSGMGAYHGKFSFDSFTRLKPVMDTPNWFDPSIRYPPLKGKLKLFKWLIR